MSKQGVFLRSMAEGDTEATIDVVGVIGWDVAYQQLRDMLRAIPQGVKRVVFDIYSPGGDVWDGNGIVQEIGELSKRAETVARVQVAASMATLIAVACQKRSIAQNGRWLIHNAWSQATGDAETMEKMAKTLRDCEEEAAAFYADRTGNSKKKMRELMAEERWMMPEETKALGFVQEISDPFSEEARAAVRAEIEAAGKWPKALVAMPEPKPEETKDVPHTASWTVVAEAVIPADAKPAADAADAYAKGLAEGKAIGKGEALAELDAKLSQLNAITAAHAEAVKELQALRSVADGREALYAATLEELNKSEVNLKREASERAAFQGKYDRAVADMAAAERAANERLAALKGQLEISNSRLAKFLAGSMTFYPDVLTWDEALKACDGDLAGARKRYPRLYEAWMAEQRQKGK